MGEVKRLNSVGRKNPNSTETNQEEKSMKKLVHFMLVTMLVIVGVFTPSVTSANAQTANTFNKVALQADTGKWLSRCRNCQNVIGNNPDTATIHITKPTNDQPYAQFEVVNVGNGKIALKADTGKYLARCNSCIVGGSSPDSATIHVTDPSAPYAQFTPELLDNGKYALKADTGKYLARCNSCSPGAAYPDTVTIHVDSPVGASYAQWNMIPIFK
ncbi:hypothetical protein PN451_16685 [Dolichospermum planctonicum CS-1226]|uniref:Uncharacterized protein n=1 Tax=Dolichospermum planctonicum CS-1226 TaxID=3021751 RepID=A0ABT5AJH7_9CYAN|nr:hypothetical protein [Dolichospermum planctonicum]MDB9537445.1 hypothetical protein [Dolichospermum planctonicum CS-1226]